MCLKARVMPLPVTGTGNRFHVLVLFTQKGQNRRVPNSRVFKAENLHKENEERKMHSILLFKISFANIFSFKIFYQSESFYSF